MLLSLTFPKSLAKLELSNGQRVVVDTKQAVTANDSAIKNKAPIS